MPVVTNWCLTERKFVKLKFKWTIKDFRSSIEEPGDSLKSTVFSMGVHDRLKWNLQLFPKGECEEKSNFLSLYLQLDTFNESDINANIKMSILDAQNKENITIIGNHRFNQIRRWGSTTFIQRAYLFQNASNLLPDGKLVIYCEITYPADIVNTSDESKNIPVPVCTLSDDLAVLLENQKFSDVTLSVGKCEFKVHKNILAARSPVFSAMFEHEMEEQKQNRVKIIDISPEVLEEVLRFIYTGKTTNTDKIASDLLVAADKYMLERLKLICEDTLSKTISVQNAVDLLILADEYNADELKGQVIEFMKIHAKEVMESPKWKSVTQTRIPVSFHLVSEIFRTLQHSETLSAEKDN